MEKKNYINGYNCCTSLLGTVLQTTLNLFIGATTFYLVYQPD